jgi:hypothetical protein
LGSGIRDFYPNPAGDAWTLTPAVTQAAGFKAKRRQNSGLVQSCTPAAGALQLRKYQRFSCHNFTSNTTDSR